MGISNKKQLGKRICSVRKNLGYSQEEVAQKLGIHRPSVSEIEHGRRDITAHELASLGELFDLSTDEILKVQQDLPSKGRTEGDTVISFFRHGEAVDDIYNQYGGWADPDLSAKGVNKAYTVSQDLKQKHVKFDVILTSPLKRAKQKAEIMGRELGVDVKVLQYLKERNTYGLLCGINKDVAKNRFPDLVDQYESGEFVLGSERYEDFVDRLQLVFDYIGKSSLKNIACVSHGKLITAMLKEYLKMKPDKLEDGCMLTVGLDKKKMYYIQSDEITFTK